MGSIQRDLRPSIQREDQLTMETKLEQIAAKARREPKLRFTSLAHHITRDRVRKNLLQIPKRSAAGVDGQTVEAAKKSFDGWIEPMLQSIHRQGYRAPDIRRVYIPKPGKTEKRPLGVPTVADRALQRSTAEVLTAIYEQDFLPCSFGGRPKLSAHHALATLNEVIAGGLTSWVLEADLKNFFGTLDHKILEGFLREKIADQRFIRYILRMFKAGVLSEGELIISEEGVPQGSIVSPILANIYAHKVLDEWVEKIIQPHCKGKVKLFRYADDGVICCEKEEDAIRVKAGLTKRLAKYKLSLNEDKTKLVEFSRKKAEQGQPQGTFDFLGFTFYWGKSRRGNWIPKLKTNGKTMRKKLVRVKEWIKTNRNKVKLKELWKTFQAKLRGHIQYYGVSFNIEGVPRHEALARSPGPRCSPRPHPRAVRRRFRRSSRRGHGLRGRDLPGRHRAHRAERAPRAGEARVLRAAEPDGVRQ
jgi:group II intron reverse transcriptase/maturase